MIRPLDVFLVAVMIGGAIWTFQIKHEAELSAEKVADLHRKIESKKEKIVLLEADWALLNGPARLQELSQRFSEELQLQPMESTQIVTLAELPPVREEPVEDGDLIAEGEEDMLVTGSIVIPKFRPGAKRPLPQAAQPEPAPDKQDIGDLIEKHGIGR